MAGPSYGPTFTLGLPRHMAAGGQQSRVGGQPGVGWGTHSSGNSVAYWIFWVKEKLLQPALEQMAFKPASLEKL